MKRVPLKMNACDSPVYELNQSAFSKIKSFVIEFQCYANSNYIFRPKFARLRARRGERVRKKSMFVDVTKKFMYTYHFTILPSVQELQSIGDRT